MRPMPKNRILRLFWMPTWRRMILLRTVWVLAAFSVLGSIVGGTLRTVSFAGAIVGAVLAMGLAFHSGMVGRRDLARMEHERLRGGPDRTDGGPVR